MKVGVLMIGSLYWSCHPVREKWRKERLVKDGQVRVKAPIRYGRFSTVPRSYTMVFSAGLDTAQFGNAIVLPFRKKITRIDQLVREARHLWGAERKRKPSETVSSGWGCIGLLPNSRGRISAKIVADWKERVAGEESYPVLKSEDGEEPAVDASGILRIRWPKTTGGSELDFDALLATATDPCIEDGQYATVRQIANAWMKPPGKDHVSYFVNNRANGITTAQDDEIADLLWPICHRDGHRPRA
ncbi:MAG: hypothetical protein OXQ89_16665 [Rhodospirillaceae bacterium]|nr:hypothetical protein [Rhodospirillaceae bacterium]